LERALMLCTIYDFAAAMQDMQTRNHKVVKGKRRCWWPNTASNNVSRGPRAIANSWASKDQVLELSVPARLDAIDQQILEELQEDGRITNVELARRVGISAPPCLRRVRALEQAGYIKGYRALLDEKRLGYEVTVFAMVHLTSQADADLKVFEDFVRAQPLVRECWMLSGEIDFILKCVAPDLKTFQGFVAELTAAPHVRNVKTSLTLRNSKDAAMVPLNLTAR
jgi:DNA-binding Lrp family transcriptional regulator